VTNKNSWGPNTHIKQSAKLTATWEDVGEELPENIRLALARAQGDESKQEETASLFRSTTHSARTSVGFSHCSKDEATHIDEIVDRLEPELSSSEIFVALFELELAGRCDSCRGRIL
jgi:DNA processing protein